MPALITTDLVALDADLGADKGAVVRRLAELVAGAGRATDADALHADAMAREAQAADRAARRDRHPALPLGGGHPGLARRSPGSSRRSTSAPRTARPTWSSSSPRPPHGDADHLTLLTALARALVRPEFVAVAARGRRRPRRSSRLVDEVVSPAPAAGARRRDRRAPPPPPRPPPPPPAAAPAARQEHRRGHRLPDRHRAHLHGRRQAHRRRQGRRRRHPRRDAGLVGRPPRSTRRSSAPPTR